jgi:serine/threonine protein kinase
MKPRSYENIEIEDVSVKSWTDKLPNGPFVKESVNKENTISTAENTIRESMILQILEEKGVQNIPRVKRNAAGMPLSKSGRIGSYEQPDGTGYIHASLGLEKIQGESLLAHRFKNESEVVTSMLSAAHTLKDIHEAGFLHNDIKPTNLMIDTKGNTIVIDFNNSRRLSKNGLITEPTGGTPLYRAPEATNRIDYDVRSDIYSLALTTAKIVGISLKVLETTDKDLATYENRWQKFQDNVLEAVRTRKVSDKLGRFILVSGSGNRLDRFKNYDQVIEALEIVNDKNKSLEDLDELIRKSTLWIKPKA